MLKIKKGECYINHDYDGVSVDLSLTIYPLSLGTELFEINEYFITQDYKKLFQHLAENLK